ncbi:MAG: hypothetical protein WCP95_11380 [Actinomycetes bacterium]
MASMWASMSGWSPRRWSVALLAGVATALLVAIPTAVIPNPVFGRTVAVTWWSYPVVVLTGVLGGLLFATYVREPVPDSHSPDDGDEVDRASKLGMVGALVSFFAVGCPVCNKLVLVALGASGAVTWFAPFQPILALASVVLMVVALRIRLRTERACRVLS